MSYERENRQAIISYFEQGAKGSALREALGVEIEHFVVHKGTLAPVLYDAPSGQLGVHDVLDYLSSYYPQKSYGLEGELIGLACSEASLSLEPAAQLEISIAPYENIETIIKVYKAFRQVVDPFLAKHDCMLVTLGYHPRAKALDLPLIPKQRYRFMNDYFHALGTHGERMMRASASTQVSVDYYDEADAIEKMRLVQALVPVIAYLTDNVQRFEGEVPTKPLSHLTMWRNVDNDRCGSVPGLYESGFGFAQYADWLLKTCPIFVTRPKADDPQDPTLRSVSDQSAAQTYGDAPMTKHDIEHLLSMFWPDVRLKRFVEIRPADSMPIQAVAGYAALIKGIMYSEAAHRTLEDAFGVAAGRWPLTDNSTQQAVDGIYEYGLKAQIQELSLDEWIELAFRIAAQSLSNKECQHLEDFKTWSMQNHSGRY